MGFLKAVARAACQHRLRPCETLLIQQTSIHQHYPIDSMRIIYTFCLAILAIAEAAPGRFVFPDQRRHEKKLDPITPPVLPVLEHLERDPSTLLPGEGGSRVPAQVKPRFGHGAFNVRPSGNGGLSASISSSASGAGISQSASQSFSFGFNEGFSASHSASQAASFNGFGRCVSYFYETIFLIFIIMI